MAKKHGAAAAAYILTWITGLIVYLVAKKTDRFTKFNAVQAILLGVIIALIMWVPIFGGLVAVILYVYGLFVAYKAYGGTQVEIPLIAELAKKFV